MTNQDELDLLDLRQLISEEIHAWRKRQPKFSYPVSLASKIGAGPAAALYYVLCSIAGRNHIVRDSDVAAETGCTTADIAAARAYAQQCGFLVATQLCGNTWKYELQLLEFSKWAEQWRRQKK